MKLIEYTDDTSPRKRACINCGHRDLWGAGSRCGHVVLRAQWDTVLRGEHHADG